jgi:hypothetical protein
VYWKNKRSHRGDTVEWCHYHDDYDFRLEEGVIKIGEVHVNMIDGDCQSEEGKCT